MILVLAFLLSSIQQPDEESRLEDLERQIEERERSAEEIRERTEEMEDALDRLRDQLASTASALQAAESRATELEQDLQDIEAREAIALEERDARAMELSRVLAALQNLERSRPPALVVSPDDAQRAALAAVTLSSISPRLAEIVEARKQEIIDLERLRSEKRAARRALDDTNASLGERRRLLQGLLDERQSAYQQDRAELARVEAEARRLAAEASNIRELLRRLRDLPSAEEVVERYRQSRRDRQLPGTFAEARGRLERPVAGVVTGQFGQRDEVGEQRDAVQMTTRPGAVVTAPYSGIVQWASNFGTLGNVLIIDVGDGYTNIFIGLDRFVVRKGQRVGAGEPVGVMANGAQAPSLRFQVRKRGQPVDPTPWFEPS
ncbi:peptidase M23 [Parvularcula lutaonensis]|nr:peptidase M23 [Parvularcula lutaonensis]